MVMHLHYHVNMLSSFRNRFLASNSKFKTRNSKLLFLPRYLFSADYIIQLRKRMKTLSTAKRILLIAIILYLSAFVTGYISQIPPRPDEFTLEDPPWTLWNYLCCITLMSAAGLTIASIKLRGR